MGTVAATFLSLPYLSFRPVTFALVLLALVAFLLISDRRRGEKTRWVWLIPPITALLTNLHLFAFFVPIWIGVLWLGAVIELPRALSAAAWADPWADREPVALRRTWRYGLLLVASVAGYLCTPLLGGVLETVWHYQFGDVMVTGPVISEFQPFYRGAMGIVSALVAAAVLTCVVTHRRRLRAGEWLWLAGSFVLLLKVGRFAPIFALIAGPALAMTIPAVSDRALARRPLQLVLTIFIVIFGIRIATEFPTHPDRLNAWLNRMAPDGAAYPCAAADYVEQHVPRITGRLVNEFNWGGYLSWRLGDNEQVFLDGRTQLYSADFWRATYLSGESERRELLAKVRADVAVLPAKGSTFRPALTKLGWRSVFTDQFAEVLIPPADQPVANIDLQP
jgi:asparagine N-glycosylation enzyme membrane subunit Stt3